MSLSGIFSRLFLLTHRITYSQCDFAAENKDLPLATELWRRAITLNPERTEGVIKRAQLHPEIKLADVIPDQDGYRVFRILGRRPPRPMSLEEASEIVRADLLEIRSDLAKANLVRFLRQQSNYWDIQSGVHLAQGRDVGQHRTVSDWSPSAERPPRSRSASIESSDQLFVR